MAAFDPSVTGIFIFGLIAGICPCNSVLCLGLIGYLTSGNTRLSLPVILKLTVAFSAGTVLVLLPLGVIAGLVGQYMLFLNENIAWAIGGVIMIAMGLQLLHLHKPPIRSIFYRFRGKQSYTVTGSFLLGLSFGAITIGRGAPMLLVVLAWIALYQNAVQGFFTVLVYAIGLSVPLIAVSSVGGAIGKKIRDRTREGGELLDRVIGIGIVIIGIYFLIPAFR